MTGGFELGSSLLACSKIATRIPAELDAILP